MLKHVSVSPWRGRADSVSLASSGGTSSCGSGSPSPGHTPPPSRASSCASLAPLTALSSFSPADATSQQTTLDERSHGIGRREKDREPRGRVQKAMTWSLNKANEENKTLSVTGVGTRRFVKTRTKRFLALINSCTTCVLARPG
ncbi:hypothetical protein K0M31_009378 [Melipona bicolor]|uniref:Uncharacterized protein n=1 Tax=Melipona bicolor TaxID=60889 RepID=A0AA40FMY2_9HYME|nr:hypothetical protein K0M31_009378 [Melipona bicolor]